MRRLLCLRVSTTWLVLLLVALQLPCHEGLTVRICIPYPDGESRSFRERCTAAVSTANTDDLEFVCVAGGTVNNCVAQLAEGEAHLTTLDGSDVIEANREHGIVPLISESVDGVQGGSYYAVAVVNKEFCSEDNRTLADLKGVRSCHTGYRKSAGWKIPVGTLLEEVDDFISDTEEDDVEDDAELVANFFSEVCAPRLSGNGPKNADDGEGESWEPLCEACKGDCSSNDQYYDYSGAFRCLMEENGDVAFVKHTTVPEYARDGSLEFPQRAWANKDSDDFRLLCRSGGCAEVTEYRDCHLSVAPSHAMVTSMELGYEGENQTLGLAIQEAILDANDTFLTETSGLRPNFLWTSGVQRLNAVTRGMETYVPSKAVDTYNAFDALVEGNFTVARDTPVSAIHCSYTDAEYAFCEQLVDLEASIDSEITWGCTRRNSTEACLEAIAQGEADWRTVSGADAYLGFARYGLTSILAENGSLGGGYDYYSVAVVKSEFCNEDTTIADLEGARSCHTGYRKNAGWDIPVGAMVSQGIMEIVSSNPAVNNDAETVAQFFSESCAPYRENITPVSVAEYKPLCSICEDNCTSSSPYAGYEGAHLCLKEDAGEVAFVKHTTVFDHDDEEARSELRLVCPDTPGCVPVDEYEDCNLGLVPARSVVVSDDNPNKAVLKRRLLAASQTDEFIELVFNSDENTEDLIFNADDSLIELDNGTEDFLGGTLEIFEALEELNSESVTVRVCIPYPALDSEVEACDHLFGSVDIPNVVFECVEGETHDACIEQLSNGEAHLTTLDGGDVFRGHRLHNIVPLIAEVGAGDVRGAYYSVAVVNEEFCDGNVTLADLQGQRSCHTGYRKMAGWRIPVGTLLSEVDDFTSRRRNNSIEDDAELVANFFDGVCAPRLSGNGPVNTDDGKGEPWEPLCEACKGDCSSNDQYYDYSGAFRCLMEENGDVAFVKHTTVPEYARDGSLEFPQRAWANKDTNDFRLLCRNGGCASVDDYEDCHLALVPSHSIVGAVALGPNGGLFELGEAIKEAIVAAADSDEFLESARGLIEDFPFSSSTESVMPIEGGYDGYISDEAETALEAFAELVDSERRGGPRDEAIFCAVTDEQLEACEANIDSLYSLLEPDLIWSCVQEDSAADCLQALDDGVVHFMAGSAAEIYQGSQEYDLRPIAGEAIGPSAETSIFSVVLVNSEDCENNERLYITNYAGEAACFSGFESDSGWNAPISIMATQGLIGIVSNEDATKNAIASVVGFFGTVCAPHDEDNDDASDALCSACMDDCSISGDYYGASGAVECLMDQERGVAITDSTVFLENAPEGVSLICPYRTGCEDISEFSSCNFGETPTDALVVSQNAESAFVARLQSALVQSSLDSNYTSILGTTRDEGQLVSLGGSIVSFLREYEDTAATMANIETSAESYSSTGLKINSDDDDGDDGGDDGDDEGDEADDGGDDGDDEGDDADDGGDDGDDEGDDGDDGDD